ncbi:MAG: caspase family protein [Bacteroidota bacterium]
MRLISSPFTNIYYLLFSLILVFNGSAYGQRNWTPAEYFGIPKTDKVNVFYDEFEDNRHRWDLGSTYLDERIQEGEFYCYSMTDFTYVKHRPVVMNQTGNYEVEIRIRFVRGNDRSVTGLTFGRDSRGNEFGFFFNPTFPRNRFKVSKFSSKRNFDFQPWQYFGPRYNKHAYNTLMVRKVSDQWYFFINQELVYKMEAQELFGNNFGFTVGGTTAVEVDNIRVTEIRTKDRSGPEISLSQPLNTESDRILEFENPSQIIRGKVYDVSGVSSLTINKNNITVSSDGEFSARVKLPPGGGVSSIEIVAKDRYENTSRKRFRMQYKKSEAPISYSSPTKEYEYSNQVPSYTKSDYYGNDIASSSRNSKNYLLLIGVNEYKYWNRLHNAVKDCDDLSGVLTAEYQFKNTDVITLYNRQATRENILETFESLQDKVGPNDNLLIYYAGHGFYDPQSELGYWVPVNARLNKIPDFIRNSTIHDYLRTINSKNTLLIADACYAGSLFANSRGTIIEGNRSRWAFTSGDIEKVWDGQPGENSPFARYLIRFLTSNRKASLGAEELIKNVRQVVERNTAQTPQGSPLKSVGDEGGQFRFYRKNSNLYRK